MKQYSIRAIFLDCGDTLVDEATEVKNEWGVSLRADLIPGANELMHELQRRRYPLALVADGPADTFMNNLHPYRMYDLFDVYAISAQVGVEKPHPMIFKHALSLLDIEPADYGKVVMVGNNLERDIQGANQLGLISVWLDWAPRRSKIPANVTQVPRFTIKQPLDLLAVLDELESYSPIPVSTTLWQL